MTVEQMEKALTQMESEIKVDRLTVLNEKLASGKITSIEIVEMQGLLTRKAKEVVVIEHKAKVEEDHREVTKQIELGDKVKVQPRAIAEIILKRAEQLGYHSITIQRNGDDKATFVLVSSIAPSAGTRSGLGSRKDWPKLESNQSYDMLGTIAKYATSDYQHAANDIRDNVGFHGTDTPGNKAQWRDGERTKLINRMVSNGVMAYGDIVIRTR